MLAKCAFNLAQRSHLTDDERRSLDESRRAWDEAVRAPAPQSEPVAEVVGRQRLENESQTESTRIVPLMDLPVGMNLYAHPMPPAWKSIDTAPTDGTVILVYPPTWNNRSCSPAMYSDDRFSKRPRPFWNRADAMGISQSRATPPTHWMPLPKGPGDSNG